MHLLLIEDNPDLVANIADFLETTATGWASPATGLERLDISQVSRHRSAGP